MDSTPGTKAKEVVPGVFHFTQIHPNLGIEVDSYYLYRERVLIDPMLPGGGIGWFDEQEKGPPTDLLLSCRHHIRHAADYVGRYGATVRCVAAGMHEFADSEIPVESFEFGDELPGGAIALEVDAISPDETAFHIPAYSSLLCSDGVVRFGADGPLGFVPDQLMDEPEKTKQGLIEAYRRLLDLDFENLLLAHGGPIVGEGKEKLRQFVEAGA